MALYTKDGRPLQVSGDKVYSGSGVVVGRIKGKKVFAPTGVTLGLSLANASCTARPTAPVLVRLLPRRIGPAREKPIVAGPVFGVTSPKSRTEKRMAPPGVFPQTRRGKYPARYVDATRAVDPAMPACVQLASGLSASGSAAW